MEYKIESLLLCVGSVLVLAAILLFVFMLGLFSSDSKTEAAVCKDEIVYLDSDCKNNVIELTNMYMNAIAERNYLAGKLEDAEYMLGRCGSTITYALEDVNKDGRVNILDLLKIRNALK